MEMMAGDYTAMLYNELENEVVSDIARRVSKTNRFTETAEIQARALRAQGYSPAQIQAKVMKQLNADNDYLQFVAENTRAYKQEVKELIKETVKRAEAEGDNLTAQAGEMAWNDDLQVWKDHGVDLKKDKTLEQFQQAFKDQTVGQLKNITRTSAMEVGGVPILDAYHHELDLAVLKTASGAFSFQQSMDDCCRRLGQGGVQVKYPSGKKYSLEAASRMTIKTGLSQLAGKVTERNIQKTGVDLVYVTAHAGARPSHAEWQGQVYSYSGKSKKYDDFYAATQYGDIAGLKGVNCSHEFYPYWEGDPIPEFHEPDPVTINGKEYTYYEATQKQREMERSVRDMSRERTAAQAAGNKEKADELAKKITQTRKDYNDFSHKAGLRPKTERMRIFDNKQNNPPAKSAEGDKRISFDKKAEFKIPDIGYDEKMNKAIIAAARKVAEMGDAAGVEYGIIVYSDGTTSEAFTDNDKKEVYIPAKLKPGLINREFSFVHNHLTNTEVSSGDAMSAISYSTMQAHIAARGDGVVTAIDGRTRTKYQPYNDNDFWKYCDEVKSEGLTDAETDYKIRDELLRRAGMPEVKR